MLKIVTEKNGFPRQVERYLFGGRKCVPGDWYGPPLTICAGKSLTEETSSITSTDNTDNTDTATESEPVVVEPVAPEPVAAVPDPVAEPATECEPVGVADPAESADAIPKARALRLQ